jgi:hypothetical protein
MVFYLVLVLVLVCNVNWSNFIVAQKIPTANVFLYLCVSECECVCVSVCECVYL